MLDRKNIAILHHLETNTGGQSVREVGAAVDMTVAAAFKRVSFLEANGFIEQTRDPDTGIARHRTIEITAKGSAALALAKKMEAL